MTTPGSNNLRLALSIQGKQKVSYYRFRAREVNVNGVYEAAYYPPATIYGAVQPIKRSLFDQLGLDLQKNYVTLYATKSMADIERNSSGDYFVFAGKKWQLLSENDWFNIDGWAGVVCVDIGAA